MSTPTITRTTLYTAPTGRTAPRDIETEFARIEAAYLKAAKRKVPVECLYISSIGHPPATQLSIVAATTPEQEHVLATLLSITTPAASRLAA